MDNKTREQEINTKDGGFLQSRHWEKFQEAIGRKVVRIGEGQASALMIFHELPFVGGYFFVPRCSFGEISNYKSQKTNNTKIQNSNVETFFKRMIDIAKEHDLGWIRVEPQTDGDLEMIKSALGKEHKIVKSKKNHEPAQTLMLDLTKSEEELLAGMKQKTRYNIRLAEKRGVAVVESHGEEGIEKFIRLTKETAKRDGITPHPDAYYRKMLETIPADFLKLYLARFEGKVVSVALVSFFGSVATYLHGASSNQHRNVMAPFALQWRAIQDAKEMECKKYDLGGTRLISESRLSNVKSEKKSDENRKSEIVNRKSSQWIPEDGSWQGITKFKKGFCPSCEPVEFPGCWDVVLDGKRYLAYQTLQKIKDSFSFARKISHWK